MGKSRKSPTEGMPLLGRAVIADRTLRKGRGDQPKAKKIRVQNHYKTEQG